jgi:endonuclease G
MGIKLEDLYAAVGRFQRFNEAHANADPATVAMARLKLGLRNADDFTSKADRLSVLANVCLKEPEAAAAAGSMPPALLDPLVAGREALFADNDLRPVRYLQLALLAARTVGKLTIRGLVDEEGDATGFLVAPGVLLTNYHVLPDPQYASVSYVAFDYEDGLDGRPKTPKLFDLVPRELFVANKELDYCFVGVAPATDSGELLTQFGYLRMFEETGKVDPNRRQAANIIQHPLGQGKKVVVRDNYFAEPPKDVLDAARVLNSLFYGADTLKGSSGSPVCTDDWYVVALHRGGVPRLEQLNGSAVVMRLDGTPARDGDSKAAIAYQTNEGTRVSRLYASLREKVAAGSDDAASAAVALRRMKEVAQDPRLGPIDRQTAPLVLPERVNQADAGVEEKLVRRPIEFFAGARGYRESFLGSGFGVPLPELGSEVKREVARLLDGSGHHLHYLHYTIVMHARRRTAVYAACNIDGRQLWKVANPGTSVGKRPGSWIIDPRLDEAHQPDDSIFSSALQRGHLYKREDAAWGTDDDQRRAGDLQSFIITNATPMIANFNNVEWGDLEDIVSKHVLTGKKVSYFAGPIFDVGDRYFNQLKAGVPAAQRRRGMRVPTCFWKAVAWVEAGRLHAAGFILDQSDEIQAHGPITEEINFGNYRQKPLTEIQDRTGLTFGVLIEADTFV